MELHDLKQSVLFEKRLTVVKPIEDSNSEAIEEVKLN
jgi:hypothetical protein